MSLTMSPAEIVAEAEASGQPGLLARHDSWERVRLGDVAEILNGSPFSSHYFNKDRLGLPLIRIRDVGSTDPETYYSGDYEDKFIIQSGDILIGMDGDFRVARWRGQPALLNQRVCKIIVASKLYDEQFLLHALQGYLDAINQRTSAITVKHLSSRSVGEIPLPLPPLAEQRRIAAALDDHLSRLDAATNYFEAGLRRTNTLSESVTNRAVSGKLVDFHSPGTEKDLYSAVLAHRALVVPKRRLRPSAMGAHFPVTVPAHWNMVALDELATVIEYGTSAKTRPQEQPDDVPVLRMGNIQDGGLDFSSLKHLPASHKDVDKLTLADGDLLFNRTNSAELVGKTAVYRAKLGPMAFASYLIRCQFAPGVIPEWVSLVINSAYGRQYISAVSSQQVGQANVNGSKLAAMPIPLPSTEEQESILAAAGEYKSKASHFSSILAMSRSKSMTMRRSLLTAAFSGKLVPQDPEDEPASVLLERIDAEQLVAKKQRKVRRAPNTRFTPKQSNNAPSGI